MNRPIDLDKMRAACRSAAETLAYIGVQVRPGITTLELDRLAHNHTVKSGGQPAPLNYRGFPRSICTSVNDVVCHGIPGPYVLKDGDIVNIDVTTILDGHFGDCNATFPVGLISDAAGKLINRTAMAMWAGIHVIKPGVFLNEVGKAVQAYAKTHGYTVVREFGGHGIGRIFHGDPHVSHYDTGMQGPLLVPGMTFTIEPMLNMGAQEIYVGDDEWTVKTADGSLSAQFENTVLVTEDGVEVLTRADT